MISRLRIRNLATIEDLAVDFRPGFSILTGETGAGKSIVIDGLRLVLGEKGSPEFIRTGEKEASVEAVFALPADLPQSSDIPLAEENEDIAEIANSYGSEIIMQIPVDKSLFESYVAGDPLVATHPNAPAAQSIMKLADAVMHLPLMK